MGYKKSIPYFAAIMLLALLCVGLLSMDYLTIDNINNHKAAIALFIANNYLLSVAVFFIACIIFVNSPFPLAALLKVLGGFFFGVQLGAVYNIFSTLTACLVGFAMSRYIFRDWFEKAYYERLKKVEDDIEKHGFYYILSLRLIMVVPYFLTNAIAGISRISVKKYIWGSALGVIPASLIYANAGSHLEKISSISQLLNANTLFTVGLVAFMVLLPVLNKKFNFIRLSE